MNVVALRRWFFLLSGVLVIASIVALFIPPALKPGIDFNGGLAVTVQYNGDVPSDRIHAAISALGHREVIVQETGEGSFFIRIGGIEPDVLDSEGKIAESERVLVEEALGRLGLMEIRGSDIVSGVIGAENVRNALIAVGSASVLILFYITWAFRRVPSPFRYGVSAIIALVHDVVIVLGLFSILGKTIDLEVNAMFITGVLTTIGYSVNDTIVVFDRVRENIGRYNGASIAEIVNISVRETVGRSLNTSITLLVVVLSLLLFAGTSIRPLLYVLGTGVVVGTYSSIFIASLTLVAWESGEIGRFFRRLRPFGRRAEA
jgi:preprotein translocase subunit SecF